MRPVVVDATVLLAGFLKDGATRSILLHPPEGVLFHAPEMLRKEATAKVPFAARRSGLPAATVRVLLEDLLRGVHVVPVELLEARWDEAVALCRKADARGDEAYVAAALALDAPVWTFDPDFARVAALRRALEVWTTRDVLAAAERR